MAYCQEPTAGPRCEGLFQSSILAEVDAILQEERKAGRLSESFLLKRFGLDVCVFVRRQGKSAVRFFELKAFVGQRLGGVGFGNQRGEGVQIDLLQGPADQLMVVDDFVRWIIWDATRPAGSKCFAFLTSTLVKSTAMAGVTPGKQNNFRIRELMANAISWDQLSAEINAFVSL